MCSELIRIPYTWGGVPIFGVGVLLAIWAVLGLGSLALAVRRYGWSGEAWGLVPVVLFTGAAIVGLPKLFPDGLPIRGYGLMVLAGWNARWGAVLLALFTIPATLIFHNFWAVDAAQYQNQFNHFMKNLAVLGGLAYIIAMGSGPYSLRKEEAAGSPR